MRSKVRGTALPETAIILTTVLLLLFGAIQLSIMGFTQSTADGAAFVAAHAQALHSNTCPSPCGPTVAQTAFPIVGSNVAVSSTSSTVQAVASLTASGLVMMPGTPTSYPIYGGDVEPLYSGASGSGQFAYGANAALLNYCTPAGQCSSSHAIYLAQRLGSSNNGINGQYAEWTCHLNAYQAMAQNFPSSIGQYGWTNPSTGQVGTAGTIFDNTLTSPSKNGNTSGTEGYIYAGDSGQQNAGMNC